MKFRFIASWITLSMALFVGACGQEGPAEQVGENIDEAAEETGEKLEDAGDKVEDTADKVKKKTEE